MRKLNKNILILTPVLFIMAVSLFVHIKLGHLPSQVQYNIVSPKFIFITLLFYIIFSPLKKSVFLTCIGILTSVCWFTIAVSLYFNHVHVTDIFLLTSPLIFLALYSLITPIKFGNIRYKKFVTIFITCVLLKYLISKLIFDIQRPGVFTENNFEVMFYIIISLPLIYYRHIHIVVLVILTVITSASFSGFLCLIFAIAYCLRVSPHWSGIRWTRYVVYTASVLSVYFVLMTKYSSISIEAIDRGVMLIAFWQEFRERDLLQQLLYLPGEFLSDEYASQLSWYKNLFSTTDPTKAFSVIYHSAILRFVYDYGIFGCIAYMIILYRVLKIQMGSRVLSKPILGIVLLNSLSVSGMYSVFFWLGALVASSYDWNGENENIRKKN